MTHQDVDGDRDTTTAGLGRLQVRTMGTFGTATIGGDVTGSRTLGDHFGFFAQQIDAFRIRATVFTLLAGPSNDAAISIPSAVDIRLTEVI